MIDLNKEIFSKKSPKTRLELITKASESDIKSINKDTILRILKDVGEGDATKKRSRYKTFYLFNRVGNNWNSTIHSIFNAKGNSIQLNVYIQGEDTDMNIMFPLDDFINWNREMITCGSFNEKYSKGNQTIIARYSKFDRIEVIKYILKQYIIKKFSIE